MAEVTMTKVSKSNKVSTARGPDFNQPICMYTFSSKGVSQTCHMTEHQARQHKKSLEG